MKITVLVDDRPGDERCTPEHGLSMHIEFSGRQLLFDFGQTDIFIQNAKILGIDLSQVNTVALSHGHYDHANGIDQIRDARIYLHPNCFTPRYSRLSGKYDGMASSRETLQRNNQLIETESPLMISDNVYFLTGIPRLHDFEAKEFPTVLADGSVDELVDDGALAFITPKGLVVISGCAHSGICNTVEYARRITGIDHVHAVVGGFHLRQVDQNTPRVVQYFAELGAQYLLTGHCTCDEACEVLKDKLGSHSHFDVLGAGKTFEI